MNTPKIYWIDLFSGAGGTTTGIHLANANAIVLACVNHDAKAIECHQVNHPYCHHFTEDIRDFAVVMKLKDLATKKRMEEPTCRINIWASLECTNYSKAKGGQPRDADSRTLAEHMLMYLKELDPDYLHVENVREFMAWGPLNDSGRPVCRDKGRDYMRWVNSIKKLGYDYDYRLLNSANFGAYTSRERYFSQFAKKGMPIAWPEATHSKKVEASANLFEAPKQKWKSVKEVLNLGLEGESIFSRKKPLVDNTLERIYAGLVKFQNKDGFTKVYNSGNNDSRCKSFDEPVGTLTTQNSHAVIKKVFIAKYFSGRPEGKVNSIDGPAGTIKTVDGQSVVSAIHLQTYYGNGGTHSIDAPSPTLTTKDRVDIVESAFIDHQYGNGTPASIEVPANTLTTSPKLALVNLKFLLNPQFASKGSSIEQPCFTLIARMDKRPPHIVSTETGEGMIIIYENDSEIMVRIKEFMAENGIIDIKMRMLLVEEMLKIQGFPEGYVLTGTQTDQKKFIGNSVVPLIAQKLVEANYQAVCEYLLAA